MWGGGGRDWVGVWEAMWEKSLTMDRLMRMRIILVNWSCMYKQQIESTKAQFEVLQSMGFHIKEQPLKEKGSHQLNVLMGIACCGLDSKHQTVESLIREESLYHNSKYAPLG